MGLAGTYFSEWAKYRRTPTVWMLALAPPALSAFSGWYLSESGARGSWGELIAFAYLLWGMLCIPAKASLLAGLATVYEERANGWRGLLTRPIRPSAFYLGKLAVLATHVLIGSILLSLSLVAMGLLMTLPGAIWESLAVAAMLSWIASLPLLALHLWVATIGGFEASVAVGTPGLLVAALIGGTSLGDGIWWAVPWAWPVGILSPLFGSLGRGARPDVLDLVLDPGTLLLTGTALSLGGLLAIAGAVSFSRREW
jgi:ABC-2 type transport system permease protein